MDSTYTPTIPILVKGLHLLSRVMSISRLLMTPIPYIYHLAAFVKDGVYDMNSHIFNFSGIANS